MTTDIKDLSQAKRLVTQLTARVAELEAKLSAQTAEPYGYVLKSGYGIYYRETLAGVEPDFVKHWVPLYTHPAKTEQPSLSDAEISNLILEAESGMPYSPRLQAVPLTTVIALVRRILAQRQDSDKDAARYRFMREDTRVGIEIEGRELSHEYLDEAIDRAIANGAPK